MQTVELHTVGLRIAGFLGLTNCSQPSVKPDTVTVSVHDALLLAEGGVLRTQDGSGYIKLQNN